MSELQQTHLVQKNNKEIIFQIARASIPNFSNRKKRTPTDLKNLLGFIFVWNILFFLAERIFLTAVDNEFAEKEFQNEVGKHGDNENHKVVYAVCLGEVAKIGGKRSEHRVEAENLEHSDGYVGRRAESVSAIQGEIPENREKQRGKIRNPIGFDENFKQGECAYLNDAGGNGKQREFQNLQKLYNQLLQPLLLLQLMYIEPHWLFLKVLLI